MSIIQFLNMPLCVRAFTFAKVLFALNIDKKKTVLYKTSAYLNMSKYNKKKYNNFCDRKWTAN